MIAKDAEEALEHLAHVRPRFEADKAEAAVVKRLLEGIRELAENMAVDDRYRAAEAAVVEEMNRE